MRKFAILCLAILIFLPLSLADCPPTCESSEDLAKAIGEGKDVSGVSSQDIANAIQEDPSVTNKLNDADLARAVESNPNLMDNAQVFSDIDNRAKTSPALMNNNQIKSKWFGHFGITDNGARIEGYDGNAVTLTGTKGEKGAVITDIHNTERLSGAIVTEKGELILKNNAKFSAGAKISFTDGIISAEGGNTDITNAPEINVAINGGTLSIGNRVYSSSESMQITRTASSTTISGKGDILETDSSNNQITADFTGAVTYYQDGSKKFGPETTYDEWADGKISATYEVRDETFYYQQPGKCEAQQSCIEQTNSQLKLTARNGNLIYARIFGAGIKDVYVDKISDSSKVTVSDRGGTNLMFSNSPLRIKGDINSLAINIYGSFTDSQGNDHTIAINNKHIVGCTICTTQGAIFGKFIPDISYRLKFDKLKNEFGVPPMKIISYFDEPYKESEGLLLSNLVAAADRAGIDRDIFIASFMQEGGIPLLDSTGGEYNPNSKWDSYNSLGVDTLITDLPTLIKKGYLDPDFLDKNLIGETRTTLNEAKMEVTVGGFRADGLIEGMAALMKDKIDYATSGSNNVYSQLSEEDQLWLQYATYNWGQGSVRKLLTQNSADYVDNFIHKYENSNAPSSTGISGIITSVHYNAGRTVGAAEILKSYLDIDASLNASNGKI